MELFDGINSISFTKSNLIRDENGDIIKSEEKSYNPFMTSRLLSYHTDCILYLAHLNQYSTKRHNMRPAAHYEFLLHTIPKSKRYARYPKYKNQEILEIIMEAKCCNIYRAKEILQFMSEEQKTDLLNSKGGKK